MAEEPLRGEADDPQLLVARDGVVAGAGRERLARFHLDEDERPPASDDEIELAVGHPYVARDDAIAAQPVKPRCPRLPAPSERWNRNHPHPAEATSGPRPHGKTLLPVEVALDIEVLDVDDDRAAVRAGEGIRRFQQLRREARHLFTR